MAAVPTPDVSRPTTDLLQGLVDCTSEKEWDFLRRAFIPREEMNKRVMRQTCCAAPIWAVRTQHQGHHNSQSPFPFTWKQGLKDPIQVKLCPAPASANPLAPAPHFAHSHASNRFAILLFLLLLRPAGPRRLVKRPRARSPEIAAPATQPTFLFGMVLWLPGFSG